MTRVLVMTSVSSRIASYASMTIPRVAAYCLKHGYSHLVINENYERAAGMTARLAGLLHQEWFDVIWTLDADCVITNLDVQIHTLGCLGPDVTICEEGIVDWNLINCGSIVWRSTDKTRWLLKAIQERQSEWRSLPCIWQTWLHRPEFRDVVAVAPLRSFNSTAWTHPGGSHGAPGCHWRPGDLVFHPCGIYPIEARATAIREVLHATG